jgi:hypothetical protein
VRRSRSQLNQIIGATILLLGAGIIFFPAYLYWNGSIQRSVAAPRKCGTAPGFESSDQAGRSVGTAELSGAIWVAGFVDVAKPQDVELLCSKFAELDQNFHGAKVLTLVSFLIGAGKDRVEDYSRRFEASDRWQFVSVPEDNSSKLLQEWSAATAGCRGEWQVQNVFVLIGRQGQIRGVYDATAPEVVQKILVDVGSLMRAEQLAP